MISMGDTHSLQHLRVKVVSLMLSKKLGVLVANTASTDATIV